MKQGFGYTVESVGLAVVHFLAVVLMYWLVIVPPLWVGYLCMVLEIVQLRVLGRCFLTKIAYSRQIMTGMTYWQYIAHVCGLRDAKQAGSIIDTFIKLTLAGCLVGRTAFYVYALVIAGQ